MPRFTWASVLLVAAGMLSSCGGKQTLQSIEVNQQNAAAGPEFIATGIYSDGKQVTPVPVSWVNWSVYSFVARQPGYRLANSPFMPCTISDSAWTIAAIAPADPNAPNSGPIPMNVFQDLISGKARAEGGLVAATLQFTCP